jgi:hypothetical protein
VSSIVVERKLLKSPAYECGSHGGKHKSKATPERADCDVGQRGLCITNTGLPYRLQRVHEAGEQDEDANPGLPLGYKSKDRSLEEPRSSLVGPAARVDQSGVNGETDVTAHDEDGSYPSEPL